ncbi:MAG: hypothetical protein ACRDRZ_02320 [Pseudonocardiaceae bacterium]
MPSPIALPGIAGMDCRTKRSPSWTAVTITPTVNTSFVVTQ